MEMVDRVGTYGKECDGLQLNDRQMHIMLTSAVTAVVKFLLKGIAVVISETRRASEIKSYCVRIWCHLLVG